MRALIRTWKYYNIDELKQHLLIVGQLSADCANCKEIGIDYLNVDRCPQCNTEFKFIATRQNQGRFPVSLIKRIEEKRPNLHLVFIDFSDFKQASDRDKARDFFKK